MNFIDQIEAEIFAVRRCSPPKLTRGRTYLSEFNLQLVQQELLSKNTTNANDANQQCLIKYSNCWSTQVLHDLFQSSELQDWKNTRVIFHHDSTDLAETASRLHVDAEILLPPEIDTSDSVSVRVLDLFVAHMQLVVNQRDQLATAKALLTDSHRAFHCLRAEAESTGMPLCQTAISFVMRHRLKTHDKNSGLLEHLPVLTRFVNCMDSLHSVIEDVAEVDQCVAKLVLTIAKRLQSSLPALKYQRAIDHWSKQLGEHATVAQSNIKLYTELMENSAPVNSAKISSMAGQASLRVVEALTDRMTCWLQRHVDGGGVLDESIAASPGAASPLSVHLCSVTSMFRSPQPVAMVSPTPAETKASKPIEAVTPGENDRVMAGFVNDNTPSALSSTPTQANQPRLRLSLLNSTNVDSEQSAIDSPDSNDRVPLRQVTNNQSKPHTPAAKQKQTITKRRLLHTEGTDQPVNKQKKTTKVAVKPKKDAAKPKPKKENAKDKAKVLQSGQTTMLRFFR